MASRELDKRETERRDERTRHSWGRPQSRITNDYHESKPPPKTNPIEYGDIPSDTDRPADRNSHRTRGHDYIDPAGRHNSDTGRPADRNSHRTRGRDYIDPADRHNSDTGRPVNRNFHQTRSHDYIDPADRHNSD